VQNLFLGKTSPSCSIETNLTPQQAQRVKYQVFFIALPQSGQYAKSKFGATFLCVHFFLKLKRFVKTLYYLICI